MEVQPQSSDRISALAQDTIEKILTLMPIRDALRTSILSKKWRYCWTRMPILQFDDNMVNVSYGNKYKLLNAIFRVLLLHRGPILEVCLWIADANIVNEIDQIILGLSWSKSIKDFSFECATDGYKLPFSFFSMQGLEALDLSHCVVELPLMFNGFSMLKGVTFENVTITANTLKRFLTNCPLLEEFAIAGSNQKELLGGNECTFVELFKCLPAARYVMISTCYMKHFAVGGDGIPQKLSTSLVHLTMLDLEVCFLEQDEISSTLCLISSSPNLEYIKLKMFPNVEQTLTTLLNPQDYSGLNLDHLQELEIISFHNYAPEMEFVKFIMAKAPVLKKARIELDASVSVDKENKMLRDLLHMHFPRASLASNFIIQRPRTHDL